MGPAGSSERTTLMLWDVMFGVERDVRKVLGDAWDDWQRF